MKTSLHMPQLELALLRRGVDTRAEDLETCERCRRHPLIGERVYAYPAGRTLCELCRALESAPPESSHLVHGPEFGHTMKILDRRPVKR